MNKFIPMLALSAVTLGFSGCGGDKKAEDSFDENTVGTLIKAEIAYSGGTEIFFLIDTDGDMSTAEYVGGFYKYGEISPELTGVAFNIKPGTRRTLKEWKAACKEFVAVPCTLLDSEERRLDRAAKLVRASQQKE